METKTNKSSFTESTTIVAAKAIKSKKAAPKHSNFYTAKSKTIALYEKVSWMASDSDFTIKCDNEKYQKGLEEEEKKLQMHQPLNAHEILFKKCLQQSLTEMEGYNELAFKKDLVQHMSFLINDKRFDRTCSKAHWSMFMLSQSIAWANATQYQKVRDEGLSAVPGFDSPGLPVYRFNELLPDLLALGFEKEDFKGDPYSEEGKEIWEKKEQEVKK